MHIYLQLNELFQLPQKQHNLIVATVGSFQNRFSHNLREFVLNANRKIYCILPKKLKFYSIW